MLSDEGIHEILSLHTQTYTMNWIQTHTDAQIHTHTHTHTVNHCLLTIPRT